MKRLALIFVFGLLSLGNLAGQGVVLGEEAEQAGVQPQIDSSLYGRDIFSVLPEDVVVRQSPRVRAALLSDRDESGGRTVSGYRIRLFLDSRRTAREESLSVMSRFHALYPKIPVFRSFSAPNYKVSAGNFRTRVEAEYLMRLLKPDFPNAFIVRDKFPFPSLGSPDLGSEGTEFDDIEEVQ